MGTKGNMPEECNKDLTKIHIEQSTEFHDDGRIPADNPMLSTLQELISLQNLDIWNKKSQGLVLMIRKWPFFNGITEHGPIGCEWLNPHPKRKKLWLASDHLRHQLWWYSDQPKSQRKKEWEQAAKPITFLPSPQQGVAIWVTSGWYPAWKGDILIGALAENAY